MQVLSDDKIDKIFAENTSVVPIVFAADNKFVPYLYTTIQSLIENISKDHQYDIVILYTEFSEYNRKSFETFNSSNVSIRFFDVSTLIEPYASYWFTHWDYSVAVYYRFFIPQLFRDYDKVFYFDADMIFKTDVAEFNAVELEDNYIGAVADLSVFHEKSPAYSYVLSDLKLEKEKYFNSGVILFNIKELKKINFLDNCISVLKNLGSPIFPDQDVLNIVCSGKVKYLDFSYNILWNVINYYKDIEKYVLSDKYNLFLSSTKKAKVIHYCGAYKPWKQPNLPYSDAFWRCARKTPFYEYILYSNLKQSNVLSREQIRNVIYRKRIYLNYLKCKILKNLSLGKRREHYSCKTSLLKMKIKDYRNTLEN